MRHRLTFEIQYAKWYLVDFTNYHKPVIVRKHLMNKKQARVFRNNHYPDFDLIQGKEAIKMDLKDYKNGKPGHRHRNVSKYEFPNHIKTQEQRKIYRGNRRRAMKNNPPKLTHEILKDIVKGRIIFFVAKIATKFINTALSEQVPGHKKIMAITDSLGDMKVIANMARALMKYYDCGVYREVDVAIEIFNYWGKFARKYYGNA